MFLAPLERRLIPMIGRSVALLGLLGVLLLPAAAPVLAVDGLTMEAQGWAATPASGRGWRSRST